jgi:hypothetical protein
MPYICCGEFITSMTIAARCVLCEYEYSQAEVAQGLKHCPGCGSTGIPCNPAFDLTVNINWQELRILAVWAENWARQRSENQDYEGLKAVHCIVHRLEEQYPDLYPLTLAGEVRKMQEAGHLVESDMDVRVHLVSRATRSPEDTEKIKAAILDAARHGVTIVRNETSGLESVGIYQLIKALRDRPQVSGKERILNLLDQLEEEIRRHGEP